MNFINTNFFIKSRLWRSALGTNPLKLLHAHLCAPWVFTRSVGGSIVRSVVRLVLLSVVVEGNASFFIQGIAWPDSPNPPKLFHTHHCRSWGSVGRYFARLVRSVVRSVLLSVVVISTTSFFY